ncbi:hypothetical protein JR316_0009272 [Psilocybe cubensis]|uniref:Uncharacterized protein n=1 Tax=Psilocybe cubensis TaxID=181762 RepID=A0ACB8GSV1_PSICU|nr:hypothetical protein JR316_0009272 [Psilocybe cubensis]KAH9478810.1 hypothetical protein JR316_0009272 [Psilocybe cubensis]
MYLNSNQLVQAVWMEIMAQPTPERNHGKEAIDRGTQEALEVEEMDLDTRENLGEEDLQGVIDSMEEATAVGSGSGREGSGGGAGRESGGKDSDGNQKLFDQDRQPSTIPQFDNKLKIG